MFSQQLALQLSAFPPFLSKESLGAKPSPAATGWGGLKPGGKRSFLGGQGRMGGERWR